MLPISKIGQEGTETKQQPHVSSESFKANQLSRHLVQQIWSSHCLMNACPRSGSLRGKTAASIHQHISKFHTRVNASSTGRYQCNHFNDNDDKICGERREEDEEAQCKLCSMALKCDGNVTGPKAAPNTVNVFVSLSAFTRSAIPQYTGHRCHCHARSSFYHILVCSHCKALCVFHVVDSVFRAQKQANPVSYASKCRVGK